MRSALLNYYGKFVVYLVDSCVKDAYLDCVIVFDELDASDRLLITPKMVPQSWWFVCRFFLYRTSAICEANCAPFVAFSAAKPPKKPL